MVFPSSRQTFRTTLPKTTISELHEPKGIRKTLSRAESKLSRISIDNSSFRDALEQPNKTAASFAYRPNIRCVEKVCENSSKREAWHRATGQRLYVSTVVYNNHFPD